MPSDIDVSTTWNGRNYFIKGCSFYAYEGNTTHVTISWEGNVRKDFKILCNINAAVAWKEYMFFKDGRVCAWNIEKLINSSSPINHWLMNGNLDGGFQWLRNGETYLFKGSEYWVFDPTGTSIKHQADRKWIGLLQPSSKLWL